MRKIVYLFLIFSGFIRAQENVSYASIDRATYVEYMNNDFKGIKKTGRKALSDHIDFYYMRMRLGIIGYNHKEYEYATPHFEEAYRMNPADTITQEYLYYAYLFSGRTENAEALALKLSSTMQQKLGYKQKRLDNLSIGFVGYLNKNIGTNTSKDYVGTTYKRGEADLNGNTFGESVMIQSTWNARIHFYNKLTVYQTNTMGIEQFSTPPVKHSELYKNRQYQYNWAGSYTTKSGFMFGVGGAFFQTNTSDLLSKPPAVQMPGAQITFKEHDTTYNNHLVSFTFGKRLKYIYPSVSYTVSNLYGLKQSQEEFLLTYYPLGNVNLYGTTAYALIDNNGTNQTVFSQKIGFKCFDWLWFEGKYSTGNHSNYMTNSGFVSFNTLDPVKMHASLDVHFFVRRTEFVLGYSFQTRQAKYTQYTAPTTSTVTNYNYSSNNLICTIKWNF